ncbi:MAG: DedA family protein [Actinomycetota bacterium]
MDGIIELIQPYFEEWGYLIVFLMMLLENSAFVGAAVPGDLVLLLAGFYAERSDLDLAPVCGLAFVGALIGDTIGYSIGRFAGRRVIARFGKRLFPPDRLDRVDRYFQEYGMWAVSVGRITPVVRTINTFAAGMARMPFPRFLVSVALAAGVWAIVVPIVGFFLSDSLEVVRRALGWAGGFIFVIFVVGLYWSYRRMVQRLAERTELS